MRFRSNDDVRLEGNAYYGFGEPKSRRIDWLAQVRAFVTIIVACAAGIGFATGNDVEGIVLLLIANLTVKT